MSAPRALLRAAHPEPTAAVTALATAVAASAGRSAAGCLLVAATILTGQLSIGWSNDVIDARRDIAAGRRDKPIAAGEISSRTVAAACAVALALCIPLSFANGWRAGLVHLLMVAGGWAYNLGLKRTVFSFVPYAVSFGALPAFLALGLDGHPLPEPWVVLAGALLGVGAHFLNVVPDIEDDLDAGVRGLPQRLGRARCPGRRGAPPGGRQRGRDLRPRMATCRPGRTPGSHSPSCCRCWRPSRRPGSVPAARSCSPC